jgi:tetratricopeptide (TPR) repeat protein
MTATISKKNKPLSKKHSLRATQLLQTAWTLHQAGQLQQAEATYLSILNKYPNFPDAMYFLGVLANQTGQYDIAISRFQQTLAIKPNFAEAHSNLGNTLQITGRIDEAITSFKKAIAIKPDFVEAYYNLGNALQTQGRLDESIACFKQAIAIKPDFIQAHNNLGDTLQKLGRIDEAINCFEQAKTINPDYAEAYNNLGNAYFALDQFDDAMSYFEQALILKPDFAEAHFNQGNVLHSLNRLDEAMSHFKQAISIRSDFPEAYYNFGNTLQALGHMEEAIINYKQAISLKPDYAEPHNKLGNIYNEMGMQWECFVCQRQAFSLDRKNDTYWISFSRSLDTLTFSAIDDHLLQDLYDLLDHPAVEAKPLAEAIISALRLDQAFSSLIEKVDNEKLDFNNFSDAAKQLSSIPLLLKFMVLSSIHDLEVEKMFTILRRSLLLNLEQEQSNEASCLPFTCALALHCFTNEYIFNESVEETEAVEQLHEKISNLITNDQALSQLAIITLATYRPLYHYPWANLLLNHDWPGDVNNVIVRQVKEPLEEISLYDQIPNLTFIENSTSQAVRNQYEENPYPRWIKPGLRLTPTTIKDFLKASPLRFNLGDYSTPDNPEILVAGCGTGQHAIKTASMFLNAHVLALDLSLASLSYAKRKTKELQISNIEYAQADIMELTSIDRQFDLIESVGVLHHLLDPLAGWQNLTNLLRPNGVMKVGLYSELARQDVVSGRALIESKGYSTSPEDIRRCRQDIIEIATKGESEMKKIFTFRDFFQISELRDLLFHVQEHRYTIPRIESEIRQLGLEFLGFEIRNQKAMAQFKAMHPEPNAQTSLTLWHEFENQNPDTFRGMYQFWLRKKP